MAGRKDICDGLVRTLEVLFDVDVVLDSEDQRSSNDERTGEKGPIAGEDGHEGYLLEVDGPGDSSTSGLNTLVEADVVCSLAARVRKSAHVPTEVSWRVHKKINKMEDD